MDREKALARIIETGRTQMVAGHGREPTPVEIAEARRGFGALLELLELAGLELVEKAAK